MTLDYELKFCLLIAYGRLHKMWNMNLLMDLTPNWDPGQFRCDFAALCVVMLLQIQAAKVSVSDLASYLSCENRLAADKSRANSLAGA